MRALGHERRVGLVQFIKACPDSGEIKALRRLSNIEIRICGMGFVPPPDSPGFEAHRRAAEAGLREARNQLGDPAFDMVVLDEICGAVALGLLAEADVLEALDRARPGLVVVLTGRNATPGLVARADTVSRIENVRHALDKGRKAQVGVEY